MEFAGLCFFVHEIRCGLVFVVWLDLVFLFFPGNVGTLIFFCKNSPPYDKLMINYLSCEGISIQKP